MDISQKILSEVHYCHEVKNIAHRDKKPEKILTKGKTGVLKLCDFGVAQFFQNENDPPTGTLGTARFPTPEAFQSATERTKEMRGRPAYGHLGLWNCTFYILTKTFRSPRAT